MSRPPSPSQPAGGSPWADDERAARGDGAAPPPPGDHSPLDTLVLEAGTVLAAKYELLRHAGFGGMAQLWVAKNRATSAEVCVKILVPEKSDDESVARFRREAYAAARLSHRAIIRIFDLVELGERGEVTTGKPAALGIVMELLQGETLGDFLMKRGKLPLAEALDIVIPLVSALGHAHRAGVVHRDLKPDNIFLATDPDGHVIPKVLDFGVSKVQSPDGQVLTVAGTVLGTPSFMSPEQAKGARNVDARSDVFSAGILFYVMLAGDNPFESDSFHSTVSAVVHRELPRLEGLPDAIWEVLERTLAKDPKARFADATELGIALRRAAGRTLSTTDPGLHSAPSLPISERTLVPALGGDSHVSVPPVAGGGVEPVDAPEASPRSASPPGRRRAVRIVVAVVGASLALTVAALLRPPPSSSTSSTSGTASPRAMTSATAPGAAAAQGASATASAAATVSAVVPQTETAPEAPPTALALPATPAAEAGAAKAGARATPPDTGSGSAAAAAPKQNVAPARTARPDAAKPPKREPSIVRDPGF